MANVRRVPCVRRSVESETTTRDRAAASTVHGWEPKQSGVNVLGQAVIVTDEQIADLRRRLARARGDDVSDG
jgi:hypothetical protein